MTVSAEAKVRARLMAMRAELLRESEAGGLASSNRLGAMQHQPRSAGDTNQRALALKRIDEALIRVDERKYGHCTKCGGKIEDARLEADPAIAHCAKCGGDQQ